MARIIHSMIRVLDEAKSVAFYSKAFDLRVADRYGFESFTLIYLSSADSDFELELTVNHGRTERYDLGNGYGHLAFSVDDLAAEHQRFVDAGLNPGALKGFGLPGGGDARFFFVEDPDGYKIEVLQRGSRYK